MNILTIDFETYYAADFSLSKLTTEEYVRDKRFEVIGVSVQKNGGSPQWFSGPAADVHQFLTANYDWGNSLALAHHAQFDGAILNWVFGIKPKGWLDTLSMGRALHGTEVGGSLKVLAGHYGLGEKGTEVQKAVGLRRKDFSPEQLARYGEYCKNDVALTWALFNAMSDFPPTELRLIDLTVRMFTEPLLELDSSVLVSHLREVKQAKQVALGEYNREDLMSNPKFADCLRAFGVEPPMKTSLTTGKQTYAFAKNDEEFKALLDHPKVQVQALVAARLGTKSTIEETRTERFLEIAKRGPLPVPLRYYAAHTGRWGGDDKLNLQNLPRSSPLKYSIIAPDGYVVLDSDSSQIEARKLAWLAEQNDLVDAFENGEDVYKLAASAIYQKPAEQIAQGERFVGKTTILGAGYGMGAPKFKAQLKSFNVEVSDDEAKRIIDTYRSTYPKIAELWKSAGKALRAILQNQHTTLGRGGLLKVEGKEGILLPNGLRLKYPNLRMRESENGETELVYDMKKGKAVISKRIYGGKVIENVCQALARIVIGEQMLMIAKKYPVVMTVHDAIAVVVPEAEAEMAKEYVEMCMRMRPAWALELPLNCEAGYGKSYGNC